MKREQGDILGNKIQEIGRVAELMYLETERVERSG